jgi:hypothetical protein
MSFQFVGSFSLPNPLNRDGARKYFEQGLSRQDVNYKYIKIGVGQSMNKKYIKIENEINI